MIAKVNGKLLSLLLKMILNLSNLTEEMEKRLSDQLRYLTISAIDEEGNCRHDRRLPVYSPERELSSFEASGQL